MEKLGEIVDIIILIGALVGAIVGIMNFVKRPTIFLRKKQTEREKERVAEVFNSLIPKYIEEMSKNINGNLEEIRKVNAKQNENIDSMMIAMKDVLRQQIMGIYHKDKHKRQMTDTEKEILDELYKDYKLINGNSYIDKYYKRMCNWEIIRDEEDISEI